MSEWKECSLGDVCRAQGGGTPSRQNAIFWGGHIPWASVKDFTDGQRLLWKTQEYITEQGLRGSASRLIPAGVPLVCTRMAVGRSAIFLVDVAINQDVKALFPSAELTSDYLQRLIEFSESTIGCVAIGSTVKGISTSQLLALRITFPTNGKEQTRIAEILDTLDEAIREAEAVIAKLRQVKAGLLHDLLTRGLDEHGHLRDPIRHPDQFQNSPLGLIPKAWRVMRLHQLAEVERGKFTARPRNDPRFFEGGSFPFAQTGDVAAAAGDYLHHASQSLNESGVRISRRFPPDTVLITIAANIGDAALLGAEMFVTDSVVGAVAREDTDPRFVLMSMLKLKPQLKAVAPQSAQANINLEILRPLQIATPDYDEQMKITNCYFSVSQRLKSEQEVLCKLQEVKRGLSNDLLNGRKRVTT